MADKIFADKVYTDGKVLNNRLISIEGGVITAVELALPTDTIKRVACLAPGFTDIHINGGKKYHFTENTSTEAVEDIDLACAQVGTAYALPALITSPASTLFQGIDAIRDYCSKLVHPRILGIHLEGPFISEAKRGAHLSAYIRKPTTRDLEEMIDSGRDVIKMITIAPEMFTADQLELLVSSGITISLGHSNATYKEAREAFAKGIHLVTHLYNAMSGLNHREPGLVGAAFDTPSVYTPIILDGRHCDFAAARIAYKIKGDHLFLISDALFVGREVVNFNWGEFDAHLQDDEYINSQGHLAGSAISLGEAVRNAIYEVGIPLEEALDMATLRPAKVLGLDSTIGRIASGYPAVFTTFDESLNHFETLALPGI